LSYISHLHQATTVIAAISRKSSDTCVTWLKPLIDGEEGENEAENEQSFSFEATDCKRCVDCEKVAAFYSSGPPSEAGLFV
jgi:hypothetical protein